MLIDHPLGQYRFLQGIAPYSAGVVAMPGFEIVHVTLLKPLPLQEGFQRIMDIMEDIGLPLSALCAMELRIPRPLSFAAFKQFNQGYQKMLADRDLLLDGVNPIARTNIAPVHHPPTVPSLHAFSYCKSAGDHSGRATFIVAGAGDLRNQANLSAEEIIRPQETSNEALREKAKTVMQVMQSRLTGLGIGWHDVTCVDIYTSLPIHSILLDLIYQPMRSGGRHGIHWYLSQPPITGLAFEMDLRGVHIEKWI